MTDLVYCPNAAELTKHLAKHTSTATAAVTGSQALKAIKENQYQNLYIYTETPEEINQDLLFAAYNILQPGGSVVVESAGTLSTNTLEDIVVISGLVDLNVQGNTVKAAKPVWAGKTASISIKSKQNPVQSVNTTKANPETNGTIVQNGTSQKENPFAKFKIDNSNLIDEDTLLNDEPSYNKLDNAENCSTKPKACKNCSCGRKELEEQMDEQTQKKLENNEIKSSCGNCYLGDAFRCSSCPYKGLPAFKPGDKIKLDLSRDTMALDAAQDQGQIKLSNGKVKLDI